MRIYLGATAGLRLLNLTNPNAVKNILNKTEDTITNFANWQMVPNSVRVLSGAEEAIFGWISALNLENGQSFGSLDMGGASAQKVNSCQKDLQNCSIYQLFDEDFSVSSSSALCYGLEEAIKRFVAALIYDSYRSRKTLENLTILNPCLPPR